MTRRLLISVTVLAAFALVAVPAMAQAPAPPTAGPWGGQVPLTKEQIEYAKKAQELHAKIRAAQLDVLSLQQQGAEQKKIDAKTEEVNKLRTQLHELNINNRPALAPAPGLGLGRGARGWAGGPGTGVGRGPCGMGLGPGYGAGYGWQQGWRGARGRGGGFGGGWGRGGGAGWGGSGAGGYGPFCPYRPF